jgi:hypothetical protein
MKLIGDARTQTSKNGRPPLQQWPAWRQTARSRLHRCLQAGGALEQPRLQLRRSGGCESGTSREGAQRCTIRPRGLPRGRENLGKTAYQCEAASAAASRVRTPGGAVRGKLCKGSLWLQKQWMVTVADSTSERALLSIEALPQPALHRVLGPQTGGKRPWALRDLFVAGGGRPAEEVSCVQVNRRTNEGPSQQRNARPSPHRVLAVL